MAKEWETFVRKFSDMKDGEVELFIKDLTPGPRKYDTKHVRAHITKKKTGSKADVLWVRSEAGFKNPSPWSMKIIEELPEWVDGKPWEDVLEIIERSQKKNVTKG